MSKPLFTNNAATALAVAITPTSTVLQITAGTGSYFPQPTGSDYFMLTLIQINNPEVAEIVKCTSRTGDLLTVVRGQEGTSPQIFNISDNVQLRITASSLNLFSGDNEAANINFTPYGFISATDVQGAIDQTVDKFTVLSGNTGSSLVGYNEGDTGAITRTVQEKLQESISAADFNNFSNAVAAAVNKSLLVETAVTISSNTTVPSSVQLIVKNGALFTINTGITLTINGPFTAGIYQIFNCVGTGKVIFNRTFVSTGYPEWWGAITGNSSFDCSTAINACIVACTVTQLQCGTYYTQNTVKQSTAGRSVIGALGDSTQGDANASTIMLTNGTANIYQIGSDTFTSGISQSNNYLKYVTLGRSVAPVITSGCYGLSIQYTTWTIVEKVFSYDSMVSFNINGTGDTRLNFCVAGRYTTGTGSGTDTYIGFNLDGNTNLGYAGGNASVYLTRCVVGSIVPTVSSIGLNAAGAYGWSDLYIDQLETAQLYAGIILTGNGDISTPPDYQNEDVIIRDCVLDTCTVSGIEFVNISQYGAITVEGGYIAPFPTSTTFVGCLYFNSSKGSVTISQVQMLLGVNPNAQAVYATNSDSIAMKNNVANEAAATSGIYYLNNITNCSFEDYIRNYSAASNAPAVELAGTCTQNYFKMNILGKATAFSVGYFVPSTCTKSEFNCTGVNQTCLSVSPGKLDYNAGIITTVGTFGTGNYASGVMS